MPNYTIKNVKTNEHYNVDCTYSELQKILKNSDLVQGSSASLLVGGVKDMFGKTPDVFKDLTKTINFCGESFCQKEPIKDNYSLSWTTLLADKLNTSIIGWGRPGAAYEHVFKSYDEQADYTIFCWTDPNRLYVNSEYSVMIGDLTEDIRIKGGIKNSRDKAAYAYYKYLHNIHVAKQRYIRELYWFDHAILSKYKGVAIHIPCFDIYYTFSNGINIDTPLEDMRSKNAEWWQELANHFTKQKNAMLADKIYNIIKEDHEKTNYK